MKRHWTLVLLWVVVACNSDDDSKLTTDFFLYDGTPRPAFSQTISRYQQDNGKYRVEVLLVGPGISYDEKKDQFSGMGDMIRLDFLLGGPQLVPGSYALAFPGNFATGIVAINYDLVSAEPVDDGFFDFLHDGSVMLELEDEEYTVRFDLTDDAGRSFRGKYTGAIKSFEKPSPVFFGYGGELYPPFTQLAQRVTKEAENFDVDLMLLSSGITYDIETKTFSGAGNILRFDFELSAPFPADGEYEIDAFNREVGTLYLAMIGIDVDTVTGLPGEDGVFYLISEGTMTLHTEGNEYLIEFDLVDPADQTVKGRYRGPISIHWE